MKYLLLRYEKYGYWFIVFYISIIVYKIMTGLHAHNFNSLCDASRGVLIGRPHWLAFQNRLLGPFLVDLISQIGNIGYCQSLTYFNKIMVITEYIILYFVLIKYTRNLYNIALTYVVYFSIMLLGIQHYWSYSWDYIEIIIFTLFSYFIFTEKSSIYFVVLFFVSILNRESALFIALFLIIDSFHIKLPITKYQFSIYSIKKFLIGLLLLVIGIIYIKFIRSFLFIESMIEGVGADSAHQTIGNHFIPLINAKTFMVNFTDSNFYISIFITFIILILFLHIKTFNEVQLKAFVLFMCLFSSIFLFAYVNETRLYAYLLPFLLFFHLSLKEEGNWLNL